MKLAAAFLLLLSLQTVTTLVKLAVAQDDGEAEEGEDVADEEELGEDEAGDEIEKENGVYVLTDKNFHRMTGNDAPDDAILVEFYAPWCGHCKALAPEYENAAKILSQGKYPVPLAKVDATVNTKVAENFEVKGYPTIKLFKQVKGKGAEVIDYDGPRDADGIVSWVQEKADPNWAPPPSEVLVLTADNFTQTVEQSDIVLVEFYAPWCGHCKKLEPEFDAAAKLVKSYTSPILLAKVDATAETELAGKYEVSGYPTLFIFRKGGKKYPYKGPRTGKDMAYYMVQMSGDCSEQLNNTRQLQDKMHDQDITIIGFFSGSDAPLFATYLEAGNEIRDDYRFAHTFDSKARDYYKPSAENSLMLFLPENLRSDFEDDRYEFTEEGGSVAAVQQFYASHAVPLVGHRTKGTDERRYQHRRPLLTVYFTVDFGFDYRQATQHWRRKVLEVAKDFKQEDITFCIADEDEYSGELKEMGLEDSGEDVSIGILDAKNRKYPFVADEEFDEDQLRDFVTDFLKGKLQPYVKSQPPPKNNKGPVKIVVGKTFDKIVNDPKKDVLIEFYAPWCGHCKKLEPIYKEFAKKMGKVEKKLVVAKMDATANDWPAEYEVTGYPTIYLAPADDKSHPVRAEGGETRTVEGLVKFVSKQKSGGDEDESAAKDEL